MEHLFQFLKGVYFFQGLSDEEIASIQGVCHEIQYQAQEIIFQEGTKADRFYIVLSGAVEVWKDYHLPEKDLLAVHNTGHLFGEMALVDDLPRSATVIAKETTRLAYIDQEDFHLTIMENSKIALSIMKSVSSMVRKSNETFVENLRARNRELEKKNQALREAHEELLRQERLSNLGKFASLILHDIRNPISVMRSLAEMILLHLEDGARIERNARQIVLETDRLHQLSSELLEYSRGEIRLNMSIVNLSEFFSQIEDSIREKFRAQHIAIKMDLSFPGPVIMDQARMQRVLLNLADNARKAMPEGGTFSVSVARSGQTLKIEVKDTGVGMSSEVQQKIFQPFFSHSERGGTGLGMAIVKSIVEAHKGVLTVSSAQRRGTIFVINLPLFD